MAVVLSYSLREYLSAEFSSGEAILDGLMYKGQNLLFVAKRKAAKTIFSLQLALSVSTGAPFLETWVCPKPRRVAYFAFEGTDADLQSILARLLRGMGLRDSGFLSIHRTPFLRLHQPASVQALQAVWEKERPDLLILDPYYRLHAVSVNDDDAVARTTDALNLLTAQYGHATWLPHHEHRIRHDTFGTEYEDDAEKYSGSWVFGAWCDSMYGFRFNHKERKAQFSAHFERTPRMERAVQLQLKDTIDTLLFVPSLEARIAKAADAGELDGRSLRNIGAEYDAHPEQVRRALKAMQQEK
ncbi:MAG TPA: AAA family ATPase [Candidatus Tripitaka californicus]|uniref:AAA family ATPase n=1 Tax=Candidatus Tripitaka californicus TaxID=3367616 RepID=UPI004025346B